jgi:allophanate hydrolase
MAGPDEHDPYSRARPFGAPNRSVQGLRVGVPLAAQRLFFGDQAAAAAYEAALARCASLGAQIVDTDIEPFYEAARLLYEGPWVAERYHAVRSLLASSPDSIHAVTREIILQGARPTAVDAFDAFYRLEELRRVRDRVFRQIDVMLLPTAPTVYTVKQVLADPIQLNSRLGTYTNFVNLLDLCGLAVPSAMRSDGAPFGITLLAPGGEDALLASVGRILHAESGLPLGATGRKQPALAELRQAARTGEINIAVVGAHLSGMALNGELTSLGARLLEKTSTAPDYRLYALGGGGTERPGLLRVVRGKGAAIEVEVWALSAEGYGRFVASVPSPLSIGTLSLADGRTVKGFLVEAEAIASCRDITEFGGWRAYLAARPK